MVAPPLTLRLPPPLTLRGPQKVPLPVEEPLPMTLRLPLVWVPLTAWPTTRLLPNEPAPPKVPLPTVAWILPLVETMSPVEVTLAKEPAPATETLLLKVAAPAT